MTLSTASDIRPHAIFAEDDNGQPTQQIAWVTPADLDSAAFILSQPTDSDDGRSKWFWMRLQEGTLLLGTFPQGDTYMEFSDAGVCDWQNEAAPLLAPTPKPATALRADDRDSWLETIWTALHDYRETSIPEGQDVAYDDAWSDITTAMAWITESVTGEDTNFTVAVAIEAARTSLRTSPVPLSGEDVLNMLVDRLRDDGVNVEPCDA